MVKYWTLIVVIVLMLGLVACGASGQLEPEATQAVDEPALEVVTSSPRPTPTNEDALRDNDPAGQLAAENVGSQTGVVATGEAASVGSVDLSELTPDPPPAGGGEAVELPAPGGPKPEMNMINIAMQDLSARLGIDISEIEVVESEAMEWSDAGLGCPAEGVMYASVITPGYRITLQANDETYIYHTDSGQQVVLCVDGRPAPLVEP